MRSRMRSAVAGVCIGAVMVLCGCGYTSRSLVTQQYRSIAVKPFANAIDITREQDAANKYKVYRPLLETELTRAVINRFLLDGQLKPAGADEADLVLEGSVIEFSKDPLQYDQYDTVLSYRVSVTVHVKLWDRAAGRMLWEQKNCTGTSTYFTNGVQAQSEDAAIDAALADTSRRILERVVEQW